MNKINKYLQLLKQHDYETYLHSRRVCSLATLIGETLGLLEKEINELFITALLHDIGKLKIPINILKKTSRLNERDWIVIKQHPVDGAEAASNLYSLEVENGIKSHHEYYNGNGYPNKLKGEAIPIYSRIIAIADAYDAMTSIRPYRNKPLSHHEALSEIEIHSGSQFDPYIVKNLLKPQFSRY